MYPFFSRCTFSSQTRLMKIGRLLHKTEFVPTEIATSVLMSESPTRYNIYFERNVISAMLLWTESLHCLPPFLKNADWWRCQIWKNLLIRDCVSFKLFIQQSKKLGICFYWQLEMKCCNLKSISFCFRQWCIQ